MINSIKSKPPRVTIITPVYNEAETLPIYEGEVLKHLLSRTNFEFRIILVDDGSTDDSWAIIKAISLRNTQINGIRLSRNYGSHVALSAGFTNADGDAVATLACDLQDPPEVILEFLEKWLKGAEIVWGRRRIREESLWRTISSNLFSKLLKSYAMPPGSRFTTGSFLLVDQKVAKCLTRFQEQSRITFALIAWTGFNQDVVDYDRRARKFGQSKWKFSKIFKTVYDAFIGFSIVPVRIMTFLGLGVSLFTFGLLVYLTINWLSTKTVPGWTSQMLTFSLFFAVQFLLMGIMGEYLYRIYAEVVRRPLYFVSEVTTNQLVKDNERE